MLWSVVPWLGNSTAVGNRYFWTDKTDSPLVKVVGVAPVLSDIPFEGK